MDALDKARREIDTVDAALAALFERRMAAVLAVAEYKKAHGLPIFDAAREAVVLDKAEARIQDPALRPYYRDHVQHMMDVPSSTRPRCWAGTAPPIRAWREPLRTSRSRRSSPCGGGQLPHLGRGV